MARTDNTERARLVEATLAAGRRWIQADSEDDREYELRRDAFLRATGEMLKALGWKPARRTNKTKRAGPNGARPHSDITP